MTPETDNNNTDKILHGMAYALLSIFLLSVMSACAKTLSETHHVVETVFYRNAIALIPFLTYILVFKKYEYLKTNRPFRVMLRVLVGTTGLFVTFAAWKHLPLADATVIFFTSTLLAPALAFFILKEHIGPHRWSAILIGFTGILFIAHPSGEADLLGIAFAFCAALLHSCIHIILRSLKTESHMMVTFYFILGGALIPALAMPFIATPVHSEEIPIFLLLGLTGGAAQILLAGAYRYAPVSVVAPFHYTGLIWASGFDILIWKTVPGWSVFVGAAIIITANLYILHRERKKITGSASPAP
ncbi:MAG: DMT family transporter [Alphaproteobacteria bacterium]|nr:DMT family transporter [Alphaproteobacteria bacterium]